MHWFWAVVAALLLAAGAIWWMDRDTDRPAPHADRLHRGAAADRNPTLYRWIDAAGVVNITDKPPKGHPYTIVRIDPNTNVVPMSGSDSTTKTTTKPAPQH